MPFIRVTRARDDVLMDININKLVAFSQEKGNKHTTIHLGGDDVYLVKETPRQLRSFIKKAEGTLPKQEVTIEKSDAPLEVRGLLGQGS